MTPGVHPVAGDKGTLPEAVCGPLLVDLKSTPLRAGIHVATPHANRYDPRHSLRNWRQAAGDEFHRFKSLSLRRV